MRKIISAILTVTLVMTLFTGTAFANQGNGAGQSRVKDFTDIKGHWGINSIKKMQSLGVLGGYEDGSFKPDKALTQAELAVIIDRLVQKKLNIDDEDITVDEDDEDVEGVPGWAKKSVKKGLQNKYLNMKRFNSQVQVDRLTACVALAKALNLVPVTEYNVNPFADKELISDEDYGYLVALYDAGYITGFPGGNFNPNSFLRRAQMASIIDKIFDKDELEVKDEIAPTWVISSVVTASGIGMNSVELNWTTATDNNKVVGYKVIYNLDGVEKVKFVYPARTIKITGLEPDKEYTFTIEARDVAGNWSDDGPSVNVRTSEMEDSVSPTWPSGAALTVSASSDTSVTLNWPDAVDNVEVTGYMVKVYQNGELLKTSAVAVDEAIISGLEEDTEYTFKVKAQDAADNWSSYLSKTYLTN